MNEFEEYYYEEQLKNQKYYHGTSSIFNIQIIKPSIETDILREDFRKNNRNKVYITTSIGSAEQYAQKAADKFGGSPVVYEVKPDYDTLAARIDSEYITNSAIVIRKISKHGCSALD